MEILPETSYMKLIDLWFLWHIGMGFVVTIYHFVLRIITRDIQFDRTTGLEINEAHESASQRLSIFNGCAIIVFPAINGVFYGIYFYATVN